MKQLGAMDSFTSPDINPATGYPMIGGIGGVDVGGNPYGMDESIHTGLESGSPFDPFGSGIPSSGGIGSHGFSWD